MTAVEAAADVSGDNDLAIVSRNHYEILGEFGREQARNAGDARAQSAIETSTRGG